MPMGKVWSLDFLGISFQTQSFGATRVAGLKKKRSVFLTLGEGPPGVKGRCFVANDSQIKNPKKKVCIVVVDLMTWTL